MSRRPGLNSSSSHAGARSKRDAADKIFPWAPRALPDQMESSDRKGIAQIQRVGACSNRKSRATFSEHALVAAGPAVPAWGIEVSIKFLSGLLTAAQQAGGEETIEAGQPRLGGGKMR